MEARNSTIVRILEEKGSVIENRHSGIPTMRREMKKMNLPEPEFIEERGSFKVVFRNSPNVCIKETKHESDTQSGQQSGQQLNMIKTYQNMILEYCISPKDSKEIREFLGIKSRTYVSTYIIKPLINQELLEYTNKNSINARNQKYVTKKK